MRQIICERHFNIFERENGKVKIYTGIDNSSIYRVLYGNSLPKEGIDVINASLLSKITAIGYLFSNKKQNESNKIIVFVNGPDVSCSGTGKTSIANMLAGYAEIEKYMPGYIDGVKDEETKKKKTNILILDGYEGDLNSLTHFCNMDQKLLVITNSGKKQDVPDNFIQIEFTFPYKNGSPQYDILKKLCASMPIDATNNPRDFKQFIQGCIRTYEVFGLEGKLQRTDI